MCHQVLLPSGVVRIDCAPNTPNWYLAEAVIWNADRKTTVVGVVPGFTKGGSSSGGGGAQQDKDQSLVAVWSAKLLKQLKIGAEPLPAVVASWLIKGADVDAVDEHGLTSLMWCSAHGA